MAESKEEHINVREAAKECGRNPETVRRWVWSGKLPAQKLGNQLFIKRGDLADYCRETAVLEYRATPRGGGELADEMREEDMSENNITLRDTAAVGRDRKAKLDFLRRAQSLRDEIHRRSGVVYDAEAMIRELRDERDDELE